VSHAINYINMEGEIHFVDFQARRVFTDLTQMVGDPGTTFRFLDCSKFQIPSVGPYIVDLS
jgi:hypothetical protein